MLPAKWRQELFLGHAKEFHTQYQLKYEQIRYDEENNFSRRHLDDGVDERSKSRALCKYQQQAQQSYNQDDRQQPPLLPYFQKLPEFAEEREFAHN